MATVRIISLLLLSVTVSLVNTAKLPEVDLSTTGLLKYWGYPSETHKVKTKDGYILTLHRIPHGKNDTSGPHKQRPVFFLQHALVCTSASWLLNLPHQSLGFVLADAGFDVWMGNVRGNTYSKKHVTLTPKHKAFWDFCFDDMAKYDLPAMLDYVTNVTSQEQVYYVGHSQGTLMAFSGQSESKELQKKIKLQFMLGPASRLAHVNSFITKMASYNTYIRWILRLFGENEVLASTAHTKSFGKVFCAWLPKVCEKFLFLLNGYDTKNLNKTRIPVYFTHIPAGTSAKNLDHYFQLINSKKFQKYDYGEAGNMEHYQSKTPPEYDVTKVLTSTVLIHGTHDSIVTPVDVDWVAKQLPNVVERIKIAGYNHVDYITGINAEMTIHRHIVEKALKKENL